MEKLTWNLNDVLKVKDFNALYNKIDISLDQLDNFYENLSPDMTIEDFKAYVEFDEQLSEDFKRLAYLPELMLATNVEDNIAKKLQSKVQNLGIKHTEKNAKIGLWLQGKEVGDKPILDGDILPGLKSGASNWKPYLMMANLFFYVI